MLKQAHAAFLMAAVLAGFLLCPAPAALARDLAEHITPGETVHTVLDKGESKDYRIDLNSGNFYVILDSRRSDGKPSNIQATVELLKQNGVVVNSSLLFVNDIGITSRNGKLFHLAKPLGARLRIEHEQSIPMDFWLTVLPASGMKFLPFGFGGNIKPAQIGTDAGVGGTLQPFETAYYRITLPPGKWSISLGLKLPDGQKTNVQGHLDILDPYGFVQMPNFVNLNEIDSQARKEGILTVVRPRTILIRAVSDNNVTYSYDITIEKATD